MKELHHKINDSDGLIIGSPTYWANVSSKTKAFFDRSVSIFMDNSGKIPEPLQKGKKAVLITSCGVNGFFNFITGQTIGTFKAMKKVLKSGAGYKIEDKFKKTNLYNEDKLTEKDLESVIQIGHTL
jgi:multimeric flavodoxin WrbA